MNKPHKYAEWMIKRAKGMNIQVGVLYNGFVYGTKQFDWEDVGDDFDWSAGDAVFRIKPPEVPQWRKDMAQALNDGKVVEFDVNGNWVRSDVPAERFLDPEIDYMDGAESYFRIKPEPKPDVVKYLTLLPKDDRWISFDEPIDCGGGEFIKIIRDGETGKLKDAEVLDE